MKSPEQKTTENDLELDLNKNPLWHYIRKHKKHFSLGMFFLLITNTLDGIYPLILAKGIDQISSGKPLHELGQTALLFFGSMAVLAGSRFCWRVFFGRYHTLASEDLRNRIFKHFTTMGPQFFKKNPIGELMSLITSDVQYFRRGIGSGVLVLVDGVSIICVVLPLMIYLEPHWTWKTLIFLPLVPFLILKVTRLIFKYYKIQQDKFAELSGISQEIVAGIRVIKSFALEDKRLKFYNEKSLEFEKSANKTAQVDSLFGPVMQFGVASGTVILLFVAADDVFSGAATIGTFVAFQRYISKMVWPMTALGMGLSQFQKGMASFERIKTVLLEKTDIPDVGTTEIRDFEKLEVRNLTYQFPENSQPTLKNISMEIRAGQKVGIVGPVGSGKTTLLHLLNRLYPAPRGSIWINGHEITDITQRSLHMQMAMVPQEPFLFSETVSENMKMGLQEEIDHEEVEHWASVVDIKNEVDALPHQFHSQLGERGVNLSGGQKQRLTIARGLMTRAPVLMLDDSLSAVDHKTEKVIQEQLHRQMKGREIKKTQVIVTHRLSAIENADQIFVMNHGRIEAVGTHQQLMKSNAIYQKMAEIQGYMEVKP